VPYGFDQVGTAFSLYLISNGAGHFSYQNPEFALLIGKTLQRDVGGVD
jgi:hypothetical protein